MPLYGNTNNYLILLEQCSLLTIQKSVRNWEKPRENLRTGERAARDERNILKEVENDCIAYYYSPISGYALIS